MNQNVLVLHQLALQQWQSKEYTKCKDTLQRILEAEKENTPERSKVQLNYYIAEFAANGFNSEKDLIQKLTNLQGQLNSEQQQIILINKALLLYSAKGLQGVQEVLKKLLDDSKMSGACRIRLAFILIDAYLLERKIPLAAQQMQQLLTDYPDLLQDEQINSRQDGGAALQIPCVEANLKFPSLSQLQLLPFESGEIDDNTFYEEQVEHLKALSNYYQATLYLHARNFVYAEFHLNRLFQLLPGCLQACFLKVELLAEQQKIQEAIILLRKLAETGGTISALSLSNMANICALSKNSQLGQLYQDLAIKYLPQLQGYQQYQLMYNIGLQNMVGGEYESAVESFLHAWALLNRNPFLWLWLGEAILEIYKKWMKGHYQKLPKVFSSSQFQLLCAPTQNKGTNNKSMETEAEQLLQYCKCCFSNALILSEDESMDFKSIDQNSNGDASFQQLRQINRELKEQVTLKLAYIHLQLNNPQGVLHQIGNLNERMSDKYNMMLACSYKAEALCELNRPNEAAESLSLFLITSDQGGMQMHAYDAMQHPLEESNPQVILYVNLAAVYATQKDYLQAHQCTLKALAFNPESYQALMMMVYIELCRGNNANALYIMKNQSLMK